MRNLLRLRADPRPERGPTRYPNRQAAAAALEAHALRHGPEVDAHPAFGLLGTRQEALNYLHARWVTHLGVAIDADLEADPDAVIESAWSAWRKVGQAHPGLAAILGHYAEDPAVRAADDRHCSLISSAAGCPPSRLPRFARPASPEDRADAAELQLAAVPG